MTRTEFLRAQMRAAAHKCARISMPEDWDVSGLKLTISERKAEAVAMICRRMPLYIGEQELIVGTRTVYGKPGDDSGDLSYFDYQAMPSYVNQEDRDFFGYDMEHITQAHYAPDFSIILKKGISGLIKEAEERSAAEDLPGIRREFYLGEIRALQGLSDLIVRYANYAGDEAEKAEGVRRQELLRISRACRKTAGEPAGNYQEACQLFWFAYLGCLIENFQFVNYGRIDQVLFPYAGTMAPEEEQQLTECLLLKMFDMYDIKLLDRTLMGVYSAQHNITIGGVTRDGKDGANKVTRMILTALSETRLPEPLVSVRISSQNPPWLLDMACELSKNGMNFINYYNDDLYIASLEDAGLSSEDAGDYGFGLCQDVLIPGRGDHYCSGGVNLIFVLLKVMREYHNAKTYEELKQAFIRQIRKEIHDNIEHYNRWERAVLDFDDGHCGTLIEGYKNGCFDVFAPAQGLDSAQAARSVDETQKAELYVNSLMSPLPITSALYHGCMEKGIDLARCGCANGDKGFMILTPVVAVNSMAAVKKVVFIDGYASLDDIIRACDADFNGFEELRQRLWNAPKWGNDDPAVDDDAVEIFSAALDEINRHKTVKGGRHLGGLHQPHPVFAGRNIPATPEGRHAGEPIPVTISPENGTMRQGPTAAMRSAAKIDWKKIKWNCCLMLQYYASAFQGEEGADKLKQLLKSYFSMGGLQHQPNVVDVEELKQAQKELEKYRDLIIRMWGVSAYFIDLPKDVQDEFISRYDGL